MGGPMLLDQRIPQGHGYPLNPPCSAGGTVECLFGHRPSETFLVPEPLPNQATSIRIGRQRRAQGLTDWPNSALPLDAATPTLPLPPLSSTRA